MLARAVAAGVDIEKLIDGTEPYRVSLLADVIHKAERYRRDDLRYLAKSIANEVGKLFRK